VLNHYRLSKIRQRNLLLKSDGDESGLTPGEALGSAKARDHKEKILSQIIQRLNGLFVTDRLTKIVIVNYAGTFRDNLRENSKSMDQSANNSPEQAMLGDFPREIDNVIMGGSEAHQNLMMQVLPNPAKAKNFAKIISDMSLKNKSTDR